jgi:hypothetical protein
MDHYYPFCVSISRFFIAREIERALSLPICVFPYLLIVQHTICVSKNLINGIIKVYNFSHKHITTLVYLVGNDFEFGPSAGGLFGSSLSTPGFTLG